MPDNPNKIAFFYGPILLAGALGTEGIEDIDFCVQERGEFDNVPSPPIPVIVAGAQKMDEYLRPADKPGEFVMDGAVLRRFDTDRSADIRLIPFYMMHYQRYMVYWDIYSRQDWEKRKEQFEKEQAEIRALEARTIDHIIPGQMQPERDHNFKGENTYKGLFRDRHWRDARSGGWFSFEMKVSPDTPVVLSCMYWGSDGPGRDFDILVDDTKIATERLNQNQPGQFFNVLYDVPVELTKSKEKITVRFKAHSWRTAGGLFECRTMNKQ
jgi:hypothetical protein